jgi:hypothetical protein
MLVMESEAFPEFVRVTTWGAVLVPRDTVPKARLAGARFATGVSPVPLKGTFCVLPEALSENVRLALSAPIMLGANVTLAVQLAPAATVEPQVFVWLKSGAFVPVMVMPVIESETVPEFVRATTWAAVLVPTAIVPKATLAGARVATGIPPEPLRGTFCVLPEALSENMRLALSAPLMLGVNLALVVQLAPAARVEPQVFVWLKSGAFVPVMVMLLIESETVPEFVSVTI